MSDRVDHLYGRVTGQGSPVLFVHGLGGSGRYWGEVFDPLAASRRLAFVDLAGFARSRAVAGPYDIDGHLRRLDEFRHDRLAGDGLVLVGHSFGAVLALAAAASWSGVAAVVAFGLPAFASSERARARLASLGVMERWMATGAAWARLACWGVCHTRPLARAFGPLLRPDVPPDVARDGLDHTWASYHESFDSLVVDSHMRTWAAATSLTRLVLQGDADPIAPAVEVAALLGGTGISVRSTPGDHHLPLRHPLLCLHVVEEVLEGLG